MLLKDYNTKQLIKAKIAMDTLLDLEIEHGEENYFEILEILESRGGCEEVLKEPVWSELK